MSQVKDLAGKRFGRLLAISFSHIHNHEAMWNCKCDCGKEKIISGHNLRAGYIVSCGCHKDKGTQIRFTKHGKSKTRIYKIWKGMKDRCFQKNNIGFQWYGGKGIKVCKEWLKFEAFEKWALEHGYRENLTIDRIDSNGDYCPENCQWLTRAENCRKATKKHGVEI